MEDWCLAPAAVVFIATSGATFAAAMYGVDVHDALLNPKEILQGLMWYTLATLSYIFTIIPMPLLAKLGVGIM